MTSTTTREQRHATTQPARLQIGPHLVFVPDRERNFDLGFLARLVGEGRLKAPVDRTFALGDLSGAHRYLESGGVRGKVAVRVG